MELFLRYAAKTSYLPNAFLTRAYDARLLYVLSGEGTMQLGERTFPLRAGALCYYPPGEAYMPISSPDSPLHFVTVNFDFCTEHSNITGTLYPVAADDFRDELMLPTHLSAPYPQFHSSFVRQDAYAVEQNILTVANIFGSSLPHRQEKAAALLCYVLYQALELSDSKPRSVFDHAVAFIEEHYATLSSNEDVAAALHYHPYYLSRLFRRFAGCTLHKYLMLTRLRKAAELLSRTELSVAAVAKQTGFDSAEHFSRRFSEQYGVAPSRFARMSRLI